MHDNGGKLQCGPSGQDLGTKTYTGGLVAERQIKGAPRKIWLATTTVEGAFRDLVKQYDNRLPRKREAMPWYMVTVHTYAVPAM